MNLEEAKKIIKEYEIPLYQGKTVQVYSVKPKSFILSLALGFRAGYHSRDKEVRSLKSKLSDGK